MLETCKDGQFCEKAGMNEGKTSSLSKRELWQAGGDGFRVPGGALPQHPERVHPSMVASIPGTEVPLHRAPCPCWDSHASKLC